MFNFRPYSAAFVFITLIAYVVIGCTPEAAPVATPPPKVTVAHPKVIETADYEDFNGWTEASEQVDVRARVRGHIDKVGFVDGQIVKEGDLLFELDPRPFQSELDRSTEQLKIYQAQFEVAANEERRQTELFKKNASTQRDVEKAEASRKSFEAQASAAQEEIKRRELELSYSKITAPIGGKTSKAYLTVGNLVNAGGSDPVLTTIVATNPIDVYFAVDERALLHYRERAGAGKPNEAMPLKDAKIPFKFGLETDTGFPNEGTLDFADNRIDAATGTIQVRGQVNNDAGRFVPGSRVRVRVEVSDKYQATIVPETAILTDKDKKYVLKLNDKNVVVRRDITLGKSLDDGNCVVLPVDKDDKGLSPSDWIIVMGLQRARIDYPVEPVDTDSNAIAQTDK